MKEDKIKWVMKVLKRKKPDIHLAFFFSQCCIFLSVEALRNALRGKGFLGGTSGKDPAANAGDVRDKGSIPRLGRSPGGENGNPLQYSCLKNPMDRGAGWATAHGVAKSRTEVNDEHSRTHVAETNTTLQSTYLLIKSKIFFK